MAIQQRGPVLVVVGSGDVDYIIEPIRFELGLSRVEMVDDHLRGRTGPTWRDSEDVDALLDARRAWVGS